MTTKGKTYSERIRDARRGLDETMGEFHERRNQVKYLRHLSAEGQAAEAASLQAQYREHLLSDATSSWKIATAAVESARAAYRAAHAKHNENIDSARLSWMAREYSAKLNAAAFTGDRVGNFDAISWLGAQRDALAEAGDVVAMRALRTVARESLGRALDSQSAGRLAVLLQHDEDAEAADVLAAQREVQAAENAAADLRRRIETHRATLDPTAGAGLAGPDTFSREVFGADAVPPGAVLVGS